MSHKIELMNELLTPGGEEYGVVLKRYGRVRREVESSPWARSEMRYGPTPDLRHCAPEATGFVQSCAVCPEECSSMSRKQASRVI